MYVYSGYRARYLIPVLVPWLPWHVHTKKFIAPGVVGGVRNAYWESSGEQDSEDDRDGSHAQAGKPTYIRVCTYFRGTYVSMTYMTATLIRELKNEE